MSDTYLVALSAAVALILAGRYIFGILPLKRWSAPMTVADALCFGVGITGLALHCGAMFFRNEVRSVTGGPEVIRLVDPLGRASITWFAIAAVLVILGLRRQHVVVLTATSACLSVVGLTMYDGEHLVTHLTAIFVAVIVLAAILAMLVIPPWRHGDPSGHRLAQQQPAG